MPEKEGVKELTEVAKAITKGDFYREINLDLKGELGQLAFYIDKTRRNLQLLNPKIRESKDQVPEVAQGLASITKATEEATHKVLTIAEKVLEDRDAVSGHLSKLKDLVENNALQYIKEVENINEENKSDMIEILTALSFQDLTGQKIKKMEEAMLEIEKKILELLVSFGIQPEDKKETREQKVLEQMQKLKTDKLSQNLVDDILQGLGL